MIKAYVGMLRKRKAELKRMRAVQIGSQFCDADTVARTIAVLEADIERLTVLASKES